MTINQVSNSGSPVVTVPTLVGGVRIDLEHHHPIETWDAPDVAIWVAGVPIVFIWQRQADEPVRIDVLGTDPGVFDQLPADVRAAAAFWEAELPGMIARWHQHVQAVSEHNVA
jgi:hypothetical protein